MCVPLACSGLLLLLAASGASAISCSTSADPVAPSVVEDTAGALHLVEVMDCANGSFNVEWAGFVTLETTIVVHSNTALHVIGAADGSSWIDGEDQFYIVEVRGGTLNLTDLTLSRGADYYGGAINADFTGSVVTAANCAFINNTATFGGAVFLESADLVLSNAYFSGNLANDSGGAIYGESGATIIVSGSTSWEGNEAIYGGAIRLYSKSSLNIFGNATFTKNRADQAGGVWLSDNSTMNTLGSVRFDGNSARDGGGLIVFNSFAHFLAGSTAHFVNNSASEGGATMQFGDGEIKMEGHADFTYNTAQRGGVIQVPAGTIASITGEVTMLRNTASSSGGAMYCEAPASFHVSNTRFISNSAGSSGGAATLLLVGTQYSPAEISICIFEENIAGNDGGAIFIAGGSMGIYNSSFTRNTAESSGGAIHVSGTLELTHCVLESNSAYTGPAISNAFSVFICWTEFDGNALLCKAGYFLGVNTSVSAYDVACHDCPTEAECQNCTIRNRGEVQVCEPILAHTTSLLANGTLQTLHVQSGFWRVSYTSEDVRECYEEEACVGGSEDYCADGYTGPFCAVCADGFARGLGYVCLECSGERRKTAIAIAVVVSVALVAAIVVGIRFLASTSEAESAPRQMRISESRFKLARACQGLKIVIVSWQIITQFAAVASVTYPEAYDMFLGYIDVINLDLGWILSTGCLIKTNFYIDLLVTTIGPLIVTFLVLVSYNVNSRRRPVDNDEARIRLSNRHGSIIFWVSFLLYATVSASIFKCFACDDLDNLDNGKSYLRADHRIECYTREHTVFMVYAGIMSIVYPFGIPFFYGVILHRNRATLRNTASREAAMDVAVFKDLWQQYRPDVYFYEVVECLRRVLLSGVVVFIFPNTAGQLATSFIIALFFFTVLMVLNPYSDRRDGWLAMTGHLVVMMSMFVALMQKVNTSDDDSLSQNVFAGILIVANCIMILAVGAEACGICFLSIKELDTPVRSTSSSQGILRTSSFMVELPAWYPSQGNGQEHQASPNRIPRAFEENELTIRNAIL